MRECLNERLPETEFVRRDRHTVTRIRFGGRNGLFVDNLAIARSPIRGMKEHCKKKKVTHKQMRDA